MVVQTLVADQTLVRASDALGRKLEPEVAENIAHNRDHAHPPATHATRPYIRRHKRASDNVTARIFTHGHRNATGGDSGG